MAIVVIDNWQSLDYSVQRRIGGGSGVKALRKRLAWRLLVLAWLGIGVVMTVLGEWVFAGTSYVIAVFYVCLELWLWRRNKRLAEAAGKQDTTAGSV